MNQLTKEIQALIKEEAAQEFETKGYNNWEADRMSARREGYKLGAAKWALRMEEFVSFLKTQNDKWDFQDLITLFIQNKTKVK